MSATLKAMATVPHRKGARRAAISKGEAIADLVLEVAQFFFRLRAVGQKTGLITNWGAGAFGFMRSLALIGPLTVPQIAQMRPTSRQRMQRLADELAAEVACRVHQQSEASAIEAGAPHSQGKCALSRVECPVSGNCLDDGRRFERGRHPQNHRDRTAAERRGGRDAQSGCRGVRR